jgi:hypothetical protein
VKRILTHHAATVNDIATVAVVIERIEVRHAVGPSTTQCRTGIRRPYTGRMRRKEAGKTACVDSFRIPSSFEK